MTDLLSPSELATIWRLAGRPCPAARAVQPKPEFEKLRPRIHAAMVDMVLRELEHGDTGIAPAQEDLVVLLTSTHPRVRMLGVRLSTARSAGQRA